MTMALDTAPRGQTREVMSRRDFVCARVLRLSLSLLVSIGLGLGVEPARADALTRIPVVFHVTQHEGEPVAAPSFIAEQLAAANAIFRPLGIELVEKERVPLAGDHAELVTRADRDALARHVRKGVIDCFVVAKLMDVDEPGRERRGVHWHPRKPAVQSYLVVSRISKPYVLAHELGHLFGNREHSDVPGNLMSYTRAEGPPFLDEKQIRRVRRALAAMLESRRLVPLPAATSNADKPAKPPG
jgi:hypothetical protein